MIRVLAISSLALLTTTATLAPQANAAMTYMPLDLSASANMHLVDDDDDDDDDDRHFGRRYRGGDDGWPRYRSYGRDDDDDDDDD